MEELLIVVVHFIVEFVMEVMLSVPLDFPSSKRRSPEPDIIWPVCFFWFIVALLLGFVSLCFFKHTLINIPGLRILNLILAPLASACLSQKVAQIRAQKTPFIVPRNHFWRAFWFTLGFTMVRFAYATHS